MKKNKGETRARQEEAFTQYSVPKALAKFIIPAVFSQPTFLILNLADAFLLGEPEILFRFRP